MELTFLVLDMMPCLSLLVSARTACRGWAGRAVGGCMSQGSPEKQNIDIGMYKEIYYKDLAHVIVEAERSTICSPRDPGKPTVYFWSKSRSLRTRELMLYISVWGRKTHDQLKVRQRVSDFSLPPPFCSIQALNGLDGAHPPWGG